MLTDEASSEPDVVILYRLADQPNAAPAASATAQTF